MPKPNRYSGIHDNPHKVFTFERKQWNRNAQLLRDRAARLGQNFFVIQPPDAAQHAAGAQPCPSVRAREPTRGAAK